VSILPVAEPAAVRRAAGRLVRADLTLFVLVVLSNAAAAAAGLLSPWLVGRIVDAVQSGAGLETIDQLGLATVVAAVAQFVALRYARLIGYRFGERTSARLREGLIDDLMRLPARTIERAGTGDLISRATTDAGVVASVFRGAAPEMLLAIVQAGIILVAVFWLSPVLGAVGLVAVPGIWLSLRWYLRRSRSAYLAEQAARAEVAEVLLSTAAGARTVEALGLQASRSTACRDAVAAAVDAMLRTLRLRTVLFPSLEISNGIAVATVFCVGGLLHLEGVVSLGVVVAAVLYLRQLSGPIETTFVWVETLQSSLAAFARLEGISTPAAPATPAGPTPTPRDEHLVVTDVTYAYDGADVLHHVSLAITPGEHLAVVGASGAGKTTLGRLIAGIDRPRTGTVTVGGVPVADLSGEQLRDQVVLVTQEHHVFAETLRDNLSLAAPDAHDEDLYAALRVVGARWVDDLSEGLDTDLGQHRLGGAQAQHVALARVVLANPHTVVLDEATALLDPTTARHTERAMAAVLAGRTVIAVAHRLHTARDADRIAVMAEGRIVELGSHDELIADNASYAGLWRAWQAGPPAIS